MNLDMTAMRRSTLGLLGFVVAGCLFSQSYCQVPAKTDAKAPPKVVAPVDPVMQQASRMEGELGKLKDTSPEAAEMMLKLVDLYHEHAGTFGLIRVGQRFVS